MTESDIYWTFVTAADPNNKRRILAAFLEMVATYGTASRLHQTMRAGVSA
jgi:hypothetical protein